GARAPAFRVDLDALEQRPLVANRQLDGGALAVRLLPAGHADHLVEQAGGDAAVNRLGEAEVRALRREAERDLVALFLRREIEAAGVVGAADEAAAGAKNGLGHGPMLAWFRMALQWRLATTFLSLATVAHAAPNEDLQGRRAIRGTPVETAHESSELKSLRAFEEDAFPRDEAPLPRSASLTAGVGPDALRDELRSPEPKKSAGEAPNAIPWLSQLKFPDLPIRLDPRVVRYLEFYKSDKRGRSIMSSWLKARGRWHALEVAALEKAKLPVALEYVSMIESGYDPHDRSSAGAVGLWQFMPAGAKIYGLRIDHWVDQR